jgi:Glyoxalase/Bleomycin resistance protein/Dioxygenase superfamily
MQGDSRSLTHRSGTPTKMKATRIFETVLYAPDLARAERFYREVRTKIHDRKLPTHGAEGEGHVAFAVPASELADWRVHLHAHGVPIEVEVDWDEGGRSIYFRDPAGNSVELAHQCHGVSGETRVDDPPRAHRPRRERQ